MSGSSLSSACVHILMKSLIEADLGVLGTWDRRRNLKGLTKRQCPLVCGGQNRHLMSELKR